MDLLNIEKQLENQPKDKVKVYINYLQTLINDDKNTWTKSATDKQMIDVFEKVAIDKLYIDGDIITLSPKKGKIAVDYSYQAYRKKLLLEHPESIIDASVVYQGDEFYFSKESGKVLYSHSLKNPFNQKDANIIGAYCIVKNKLGEFIEIISKDEGEKMREVAKTKNVWDSWRSRMFLKSAIKRLSKSFFYDSFKNIEVIDNENYDLSLAGVPEEKQQEIIEKRKFDTLKKEFNVQYKQYIGDDKEEIKAKWSKNKDNKEWVKKMYNRVFYFNLIMAYEGSDKQDYIDLFHTLEEISDEMIATFQNRK